MSISEKAKKQLAIILDFLDDEDGFIALSHNNERDCWSCVLEWGTDGAPEDVKVVSAWTDYPEDAIKEVTREVGLLDKSRNLHIV